MPQIPYPQPPNSDGPATSPECMGVNELWFLYNVSFRFLYCVLFFVCFQADFYGEIQSLTSCITIVRPTSGETICKLNYSKLAVTKVETNYPFIHTNSNRKQITVEIELHHVSIADHYAWNFTLFSKLNHALQWSHLELLSKTDFVSYGPVIVIAISAMFTF